MDEDLGTGSVTITFDESAADASLDRLSDRIERALDRAARDAGIRMERQINRAVRRINPITLDITADTSQFLVAVNSLENLSSTSIAVTPEVDRTVFVQQVQNALLGASVVINVVPNLDGLDERIRTHRAPSLNVDVDADRASRSLSGLSSSVGKVLGSTAGLAKMTLAFGALGIAAAGTAQSVVALGAALAPAAGIIAAGPAAILGYQAALGGLKLAIEGVSDAFSAGLTGTAEEFTKATEELSPAAKAAANEVRALRPAFEDLRATVQDAFFTAFEGDITRTANALKGPLTEGLANVADGWGNAARNALAYVQSAKGVENITSVLTASGLAVEGLAQGTSKLTAGFLQAAAVVSDAFGDRLASGISDTLQRLGTFLQTAAGDGRLVAWVDGALAALAQLGSVLGNIGSIIAGVFRAAGDAGGGFLQNLVLITGKIREFVNSAAGQEAITNVFRTLATVAAQLGPILTAIVGVIGQIAPALAPLFEMIGPTITNLITALGPLIAAILPAITTVVAGITTALNGLASSGVFETIGQAVADVLTAFAPLLPVIGELVGAVASALAPAVTALAKALAPVITAISGALAPVLPPLTEAFLAIVDALTPLITIIGTTLADIITAFSPILVVLAEAISTIVAAVAPLITQLVSGLAPIFEAIAPIITKVVEAITPLITAIINALLPVLPPLIDAFVAILGALTPLLDPIAGLVEALAPLLVIVVELIAPILELVANIVSWTAMEIVVPIIEGIVAVLTTLIEIVTDVVDGVVWFVEKVIEFFTRLKDEGPEVIGEMVDKVQQWFEDMGERVAVLLFQLYFKALLELGKLRDKAIEYVADLVVKVQTFFRELPDKVRTALSNLGLFLGQKFIEARTIAVNKVRDIVDDVVTFLRELPSKARAALSNLSVYLGQRIIEARTAVVDRVRSLVNDVVAFVRELPGKARSALSGIGSTMYSAGVDLIRGMINGVQSMAGSIASAARDVVKGAVDSAKNFLGIQSPSKVFRQIGVFVGQGFVRGLTASEESIKRTADKLAELVVDAFKGKKTRRDDALVRVIRENQRELEGLARRRERLVERIREANEFAFQTAEQTRQSFSLGSLFTKSTEKFNEDLKKFQEAQKKTLAARSAISRDLTKMPFQGAISAGNVTGGARVQRPENVIDSLTKRVRASEYQIRRFTNQVDKLAKRGLNRSIISQLFELGPEEGAALAQQLSKASNAQLRGLNRAQTSLDAAAKRFGQKSADFMFDAGAQAGKGLLAGLRAQQKDIENLMVSIAKSMQKAIKKALGIKSPSTVFRAIGVNTVQGLVNGLDAMTSDVLGSSKALATAVTVPFSNAAVRPATGLSDPLGYSTAAGFYAARTRAPAVSGPVIENNVVINEVGNGEATAARVLNRIALAAI